VRRQRDWTPEQIVEYNLRDGGTAVTVFGEAQKGRVDDAKEMLSVILETIGRRATIVEPGCSAGDISGPFAEQHEVWGCDIVPAAVKATEMRYPAMVVVGGMAEDMEPIPCDVLVLCEFLEHIHDPVAFVKRWMPLAKYTIISHPLVRDGVWDPEPGHIWAYYEQDFWDWWPMGGHRMTAWSIANDAYSTILGMGERTMDIRFDATYAEDFEEVYRNNAWRGVETRSTGPRGAEAVPLVVPALEALAERLGVESVLDVGCGEGYWMPDLPGYVGIDVSQEALKVARERHPDNDYRLFRGEDLPACGLVICRSTIQHMSVGDGVALLDMIRASGAKWLLATTYPEGGNEDIPFSIRDGVGYKPDMTEAPFGLGAPQESLRDIPEDAVLGLWRLREDEPDVEPEPEETPEEKPESEEEQVPRHRRRKVREV
jgi:SAM-dependent methyltransferase